MRRIQGLSPSCAGSGADRLMMLRSFIFRPVAQRDGYPRNWAVAVIGALVEYGVNPSTIPPDIQF